MHLEDYVSSWKLFAHGSIYCDDVVVDGLKYKAVREALRSGQLSDSYHSFALVSTLSDS